jgi:hypothetical protein
MNIIVFSGLEVSIPSLGFSAIVAGVFGYLTFSTLHFIKEYFGVKFDRSILQLMWLILYINLALISLIYGYYPIIVVLLALILISIYYTHKDFKKIFLLIDKVKPLHRTIILVSLMLCLCLGLQGLFPETIINGKTLTNILSHYVGYVFGFIVPAVISIYIINRTKYDM